MIKYEDVKTLAELQVSLQAAEHEDKQNTALIDERLSELTELRKKLRQPHIEEIECIKSQIDDMKTTIVEGWDGKDKTILYVFGTLRLTTRKKLVIGDTSAMMVDVISHIEPKRVIDYVKGLEPKKITEYIGTFPQPPEVAEIVSTTTASFKK